MFQNPLETARFVVEKITNTFLGQVTLFYTLNHNLVPCQICSVLYFLDLIVYLPYFILCICTRDPEFRYSGIM